jgi:hypothetical protein
MRSPPATAPPDTAAYWQYHPDEITHRRQFLAVTKSNIFKEDTRPELDAVPITVFLEIPALLQCLLPPIPNAPELDTIHTTTNTTFNDHVTTLPTWGLDLIFHTMEKPFTTPLHQLLRYNCCNSPRLSICLYPSTLICL